MSYNKTSWLKIKHKLYMHGSHTCGVWCGAAIKYENVEHEFKFNSTSHGRGKDWAKGVEPNSGQSEVPMMDGGGWGCKFFFKFW